MISGTGDALIAKAAHDIAGDNPPAWLIPVMSRFVVQILCRNVEIEAAMPGREEWRERLTETVKAAKFILKQLEGDYPPIPRISDPKQYLLYDMLLSEDDNGALPHSSELHHGLNFIVERCGEKLAGLPNTQGGKRPVAEIVKNNTPDGMGLCALMVRLLWKRVHGRWPGIHRDGAQAACEALWQAAGSDRTLWGSSNSGWRQHLEEARDNFQKGWQAEALSRMINEG